jgi:hypothetical protein
MGINLGSKLLFTLGGLMFAQLVLLYHKNRLKMLGEWGHLLSWATSHGSATNSEKAASQTQNFLSENLF